MIITNSFVFERTSLFRFFKNSDSSKIESAVGAPRKGHIQSDVICFASYLDGFCVTCSKYIFDITNFNSNISLDRHSFQRPEIHLKNKSLRKGCPQGFFTIWIEQVDWTRGHPNWKGSMTPNDSFRLNSSPIFSIPVTRHEIGSWVGLNNSSFCSVRRWRRTFSNWINFRSNWISGLTPKHWISKVTGWKRIYRGYEIRNKKYLGIVLYTTDNAILEIARLFWICPNSLSGFHRHPNRVMICSGAYVLGTLP